MSLEEEIAKRLASVQMFAIYDWIIEHGAIPDGHPIPANDKISMTRAKEEAVAKEVIRLMEWSRRLGYASAKLTGSVTSWEECDCDVREWGSHNPGCHKLDPLTLPPPEWTP